MFTQLVVGRAIRAVLREFAQERITDASFVALLSPHSYWLWDGCRRSTR